MHPLKWTSHGALDEGWYIRLEKVLGLAADEDKLYLNKASWLVSLLKR